MKISIIMPTYNGLNKFLKEAIASVMAQQEQAWELLISGDGLNDRAWGHFRSRTMPQALQRCLTEWSLHAPALAFIRFNHRADGFSVMARFETQDLPALVQPAQSHLLFFVSGCIPSNLSNVSLRTHVPEQHGWFKPELPYAGDFEFWSRVGSKAPWAVSHTRTTQIRLHPGQASKNLNHRGQLMPQMRSVLSDLFERAVAKGHRASALRLFGTVFYVSMHRSRGLQVLLRTRSAAYLQMVNQHFGTACFATGSLSSWLLFALSAGGRLGRVPLAKRLLAAR